MYDINKLIKSSHFSQLLSLCPLPRQKKTGRPRCNKKNLVSGIIQVLVLDIPWNKMYDCGCSSSSCFRYFKEIQRRGRLKKIFKQLANKETDTKGLPVDVEIDKGNIHDKTFLYKHIKNTRGKRKKILNLDNVYVSIDLRRQMRQSGTYVNMETRKNDYIRKKGPKFKLKKDKYKVRFLVERAFAWIENFKRCKYRTDYTVSSFRAWVYLALIIILIRQ